MKANVFILFIIQLLSIETCAVEGFILQNCPKHGTSLFAGRLLPFESIQMERLPLAKQRMRSSQIFVQHVKSPVAGDDVAITDLIPPSKKEQTTSCIHDPKKSKLKIRIRMTQEADIAPIASVLAAARSPTTVEQKSNVAKYVLQAMNWKHHLESLWAKADIEALLRRRMLTMQLGQQGYKNMLRRLEDDRTVINDRQQAEYTDQELLKLFWYHSDVLRTMIAKCGSETSEDNIWIQHANIAITPMSWNWLRHVQLTATIYNETLNQVVVVGFVEVAMLHNPLLSGATAKLLTNDNYQYNDGREPTNQENNCVVYIEPYASKLTGNSSILAFSPAITNLATSPGYRRMGVASRLLKFAERYCSAYWRTQSSYANELGLYVEKTNLPAVSLYSSLGYQVRTSSPGKGTISEMWYMTKTIKESRAAAKT